MLPLMAEVQTFKLLIHSPRGELLVHIYTMHDLEGTVGGVARKRDLESSRSYIGREVTRWS